jgi:sirohydrochlorin cobaltochelatase
MALTAPRTGIVVASFGTSYPEAEQASIVPCEKALTDAFPQCIVRRGWSSRMVVSKLKKRDGRHVESVEEAIQWFVDQGIEYLCVQPLHLLAGHEFHRKVLAAVSEFDCAFDRLAVGMPVFESEQDYRDVATALAKQIDAPGTYDAAVLMGHGTDHPSHAAYGYLQLILEDEGVPAYVGTVEAFPRIDDIIPRLRRDGVERVVLQPLLLVAGDHATNDMASDDDDSWKSRLKAAGFEVTVDTRALGENPLFREIYVRHAREAMAKWEGGE